MTDLHAALAAQALRLVPSDAAGRMRDLASTAQQFACMALVAMGVAEARPYGCDLTVPPGQVADRVRPEGLWPGDAAQVLLVVAHQARDIVWPQNKARRAGQFQVRVVQPQSPQDRIDQMQDALDRDDVPGYLTTEAQRDGWRKAQRIQIAMLRRSLEMREIALPEGLSRVRPEIAGSLEALGWIAEDRWTDAAQVALWRTGVLAPCEGVMSALVAQARATLPVDARAAVEAVKAPPPLDEIAQRARDWGAREEAWLARMPEAARARAKPSTVDERCEVLLRRWPQDAERRVTALIEARWRAELGWDSGAALLPLFHDRLAARIAKGLIEA